MLTPTLLRQGLLAASLLLIGPAALAQTTKVKAKPRQDAVVKQKTSDGEKTTAKMEAAPAADQAGVMVGGAMMIPSRDIVDNAVLSQDHTTLVALVKQAGLAETLKGRGPFTVFAPTNDAFNKLPAGTAEQLSLPENRARLSGLLGYHVVPGSLRAADLNDGQTLKTVQGQTLLVKKDGSRVMLIDQRGIITNVTTPDVISSNGVTHVIDAVMTPLP